jgi:branched-subunit amino acid transport protein
VNVWYAAVAIAGLGLITLVTRAFFLLPRNELPLPGWLKQGLRYAPLAALAAVVVPEVVMTQGELISTWRDARLPAVVVATVIYFWSRSILATIVGATTAMLLLRLGLGW